MLSLIDGEVRGRIETLKRQFQSNRPFRHVVVDRFLEPAFCELLISEFPAFDETKARNELGEVGRKAATPDIARIGPAYAQLDRLMRSRDFLNFAGELTGIPKLVYDPEYIGGGTHENLHGQDLDTHVDFNYSSAEAAAPPFEPDRLPESGVGRIVGRVSRALSRCVGPARRRDPNHRAGCESRGDLRNHRSFLAWLQAHCPIRKLWKKA